MAPRELCLHSYSSMVISFPFVIRLFTVRCAVNGTIDLARTRCSTRWRSGDHMSPTSWLATGNGQTITIWCAGLQVSGGIAPQSGDHITQRKPLNLEQCSQWHTSLPAVPERGEFLYNSIRANFIEAVYASLGPKFSPVCLASFVSSISSSKINQRMFLQGQIQALEDLFSLFRSELDGLIEHLCK